jgi:serine/threonine protein phosphatase PrpC
MELLENSFNLLDRRLLLRCEKENIKSGATACCVLIEEGSAHLAWCGDSSAGVLSSIRVTTLTRRHVPNDPVSW